MDFLNASPDDVEATPRTDLSRSAPSSLVENLPLVEEVRAIVASFAPTQPFLLFVFSVLSGYV
jgi:hypothetical protein